MTVFLTRVLSVIIICLFLSSCANLSQSHSELDGILQRGILRVGTTGDYAPFSESYNSGFRGTDIDLARDLAHSLNVEVVFVKTSWPTLMKDLSEDRFDIAMSGVSKTLERQRLALFSEGYVEYGKMGISRCEKAKSFKTLKAIDKKGVRLMVNPGGTNEKFARKNIRNAKIIVNSDNTKIFEALIKGKADLMITDSVEVHYQAKKSKGKLCPTMSRPMTFSEIAVLMRKDFHLKEYIDTWLYFLKKNGKLIYNSK